MLSELVFTSSIFPSLIHELSKISDSCLFYFSMKVTYHLSEHNEVTKQTWRFWAGFKDDSPTHHAEIQVERKYFIHSGCEMQDSEQWRTTLTLEVFSSPPALFPRGRCGIHLLRGASPWAEEIGSVLSLWGQPCLSPFDCHAFAQRHLASSSEYSDPIDQNWDIDIE